MKPGVKEVTTPFIDDSGGHTAFSARKRAILESLALGMSIREAAARLDINQRSLERDLTEMIQTVHTFNSLGLVMTLAYEGALDPTQYIPANVEFRVRYLREAQREILDRMIQPPFYCTVDSIAEALGKSTRTVEKQLADVRNQLRVRTNIQSGLAIMSFQINEAKHVYVRFHEQLNFF